MDSRRRRNFKNNFDRTMLDKQVDKIFETGRQLVDGVSGARPGGKRYSEFQGISRRNVKNVGRWVSNKMDSLFEEEDWSDQENIYDESSEIKSFTRQSREEEFAKPGPKRPLEALSLRQAKNFQINEQKKLPYTESNSFDEWPDDSDLKVNRWQRSSERIKDNPPSLDKPNRSSNKGRSLPKSRRRRI
tara:strand:- start:703 stop:1266 length:564 start_codon:yes stop_codon:yes gene_type:complete